MLLIVLFLTNISSVYSQNPNPATPPCVAEDTSTHSGGGGGPLPRFAPKLETLYDIRDKTLAKSVRGKRYINQYYFVSKIEKDFTKLSLESLTDIIGIMPLIYDAYDNFIDPKYTGEIVSKELKNKLIDVLNAYKGLSDDSEYKDVIDGLIHDTELIVNKNKSEVIQFMNQ